MAWPVTSSASLPKPGDPLLFEHLPEQSHGESFLDIALSRFDSEGFYILDESESALSGQGQLALLRVIHDDDVAENPEK